jgi:hypothetical protein
MARQLDAEATAELLDRSLAHRVRDGTRSVDVGEHRTHQHDLATAADHGVQRGRHRVDDPGHVDGHDTIHLVGRERAECAATAKNASVGNCDVDTPELLVGSAHRLLERIILGDIAFKRQSSAAWERRRNPMRRR